MVAAERWLETHLSNYGRLSSIGVALTIAGWLSVRSVGRKGHGRLHDVLGSRSGPAGESLGPGTVM